jgi:anti-sigma regulatory factor (Ser/Thr protein kinase)
METVAAVKYGGRKKGTPNRLTKEVRAVLKELVFNEISHFEKLDPKERIELLIKLMPYVCPKIQPACHSLNEPMDFNF